MLVPAVPGAACARVDAKHAERCSDGVPGPERAQRGAEGAGKLRGEPEQLEASADCSRHEATPRIGGKADWIASRGGALDVGAGPALVRKAYLHAGDARAARALKAPHVARAREHERQAVDAVDPADPTLQKWSAAPGAAPLRA